MHGNQPCGSFEVTHSGIVLYYYEMHELLSDWSAIDRHIYQNQELIDVK